ncbi:hypothetical protein C8J56DRAFT_1052296 [Mycena floridula]|nr:hypothetical protein C8J56DRAFT_1052296 [Mycena floridula]
MFVAASAAPGAGAEEALGHRSERAAPGITLCIGSVSQANNCITIPIISDSCINFMAGTLS